MSEGSAPDVLQAAEFDLSNCYQVQPPGAGKREFDRNSVDGIRKSLNHCHDVNKRLIAVNAELVKLVDGMRRRDNWRKWMIRGLMTLVGAQWSILLIFGDRLLGCLLRK